MGGKTIHTFRSKKPRLCRGSHGSSGASKSYLCPQKERKKERRKEDSEGENRENDFHGELDTSLSHSAIKSAVKKRVIAPLLLYGTSDSEGLSKYGDRAASKPINGFPVPTSDNAVFREGDVAAVRAVDEDAEPALVARPAAAFAAPAAVVDVLQVDVRRELVAPGRRVRHHAAGRPRAAVQLHAHADRPRVAAVGQEAHLGKEEEEEVDSGATCSDIILAGLPWTPRSTGRGRWCSPRTCSGCRAGPARRQ